MQTNYHQAVTTRYHIYNSLFLNLPYSNVYRTGTLLPLLHQYCEEGYNSGKDPKAIIRRFFRELVPKATRKEQFDLLFGFIQYAERQVVLFDSVEDAAFADLNDMKGGGTASAMIIRAQSENLSKQLLQKLEDFSIRIVLTAHPTQFYPGSVLAIINDLDQSIRTNHLEHINLLLKQLGKTPFFNREKPTPFDEATSLSWFLENVFYKAIPAIIDKITNELNIALADWKNFDLVKIGFWPGGDRDGNPYVTHDITVRVAQHLREGLLKCYHRDLRILRRRLTFKDVDTIIIEAERRIYNAAYGLGRSDSYKSAAELIEDLESARSMLIKQHDGLFLNLLDKFIAKVKIFGFYFASMDIRQDSRKHIYVWNAILKQLEDKQKKIREFNKLDEEGQIDLLLKLRFKPSSLKFDDPFITEVLESFEVINEIQEQNGEEGCHRYVISNCQSALDMIRVFQLATLIVAKDERLPLDIVPLFETIEDLLSAPEVMTALYQIPAYREHLKKRGNKQTIMLGFSDGTKDGGYLRANWSIFCAKEELTRVSRENDITVVFFDGRGGPPARGGGNTHDFYASLGDTIEDNEVQVTVQGQTISSNFGKFESCLYNLEQLLSAGIENDVFLKHSNHLTDEDKSLLELLAKEGHRAYLDLKLNPKFVPYLEKATPLAYFGDTNIGSRPVKRSQEESRFEDLRAIPFVGSWAQMKQNIPGFYGVGTALRQLKRKGKMKALKELFNRSLFFRTLLSNSMMSMTKSYFPATAYLSRDKEFGTLWKKMFNEYNLSVDMVLEVTELSELMENNPLNRDSVKLRERIVLPLITIQQYALQHLRSLEASEKPFEKNYR
ncbi:MAG TPA: phosphoenolpyruvate carboxylase, partial [Cyclobacteriaceae bacterium]|nr:phosphoenolpyruvate carboxylase [Cyclobacteriaceae bacterium]